MANPTARQRLIEGLILRAASGLPLWYVRSTFVDNAFDSASIAHVSIDGTYSAVTNQDGLEAFTRALEAARINSELRPLDALYRGEQHRVAAELTDRAAVNTAAATADTNEVTALEAVTFP